MPLVVKDYTWEETDTMVWITVPLKGVKSNRVDITSCRDYLKVSLYYRANILLRQSFLPR